MNIVFKDKEGNVETIFNEIKRDVHALCFTVQVNHDPFMAVMAVDYSFQEISMFTKGLSDMKKRIIDQLTFASYDRTIVINLTMDNTGHIYSSVIMNASSRGYLNFKFDFDQSFIDEMFNDVCVN